MITLKVVEFKTGGFGIVKEKILHNIKKLPNKNIKLTSKSIEFYDWSSNGFIKLDCWSSVSTRLSLESLETVNNRFLDLNKPYDTCSKVLMLHRNYKEITNENY